MLRVLLSRSDASLAIIGIGASSVLINILNLTGSIFMLEVYDRVIPSKSLSSLAGLFAICCLLYSFQVIFEIIRGRLLTRMSETFYQILNERVFLGVLVLPLRKAYKGDGRQPLGDLEQIKSVLSGTALTALFDFPWIPLYIFIAFAFHYLLGLAIVAGALILIAITVATNLRAREHVAAAAAIASERSAFAAAAQGSAEAIASMGMTNIVVVKWSSLSNQHNRKTRRSSDVIGGFGAFSRTFRYLLQSAILAIGALLVIRGETTAGTIIASSILTARALAPIDTVISNWRSLIAARQAWRRLESFLAAMPISEKPLALPPPTHSLVVEGVTGGAPGQSNFAVSNVSFSLRAGSALCVIGPCASGKSSLAKMVLGIWPTFRGSVRLDNAPLHQWNADRLGQHMGYLPQDVELMPGTVAENIARFDPAATPASVIAAAHAARVHRLVLNLPNGYDTEIGPGGLSLSSGQRQRIGLARALYMDPFLVVLDEPNSNLDAEGEHALGEAIAGVRHRGGIAIVIAHRPSALQNADHVLVMNGGHMQLFGEKDTVMSVLLNRGSRSPTLTTDTRKTVESNGNPHLQIEGQP